MFGALSGLLDLLSRTYALNLPLENHTVIVCLFVKVLLIC